MPSKPLDAFEAVNLVRGWRRWECRECVKRRTKLWADESRERLRAHAQQWYAAHREEIKSKVKRWAKDNPDRRRHNVLAHYYRLQYSALQAYGGPKCACCGETEPLFLTIDHVRSDGAAHRRAIGSLGGARFYKWLRDREWPEGFQVLCMNCNHGRHRNKGICPHKEGVTTIPKGSTAKRREARGPRTG